MLKKVTRVVVWIPILICVYYATRYIAAETGSQSPNFVATLVTVLIFLTTRRMRYPKPVAQNTQS